MQSIILENYTLTGSDFGKMFFGIFYGNAFEIKYLTTRKYRWYNFMFFGCGQNKNGMFWRFF